MEWERFVKAITDSNELLRSYERKDNVIFIGSALGSYDFGRGVALMGRGVAWCFRIREDCLAQLSPTTGAF